jgi:hypothetical protein
VDFAIHHPAVAFLGRREPRSVAQDLSEKQDHHRHGRVRGRSCDSWLSPAHHSAMRKRKGPPRRAALNLGSEAEA